MTISSCPKHFLERKVYPIPSKVFSSDHHHDDDLHRHLQATFSLTDFIINPVSNCFFPDLEPVWRECARVLEPGGTLIWGFNNPVNFLFDCDESLKGNFVLKYAQPYSDETCLTAEERERCMGVDSPYEFGHSWETQIGALLRNGFILEDLFEDIWHKEQGLNKHFPLFIAARARRL